MSRDVPVLNSLNMVVQDVDASVAFYRELGLDIPDSAVWRTASGAHHVDLKLPGGFSLDLDSHALARVYNAGFRPLEGEGARCVVGFTVPTREAVDECHRRMTAAGYRSIQSPYDTFWGARYAIVGDPDGNHVGVMSPPDPARRGGPPSL